ncbi:AzlD family protein [Wielerella bovis]|uniref:AzlD family protein n=1 Tax=Wielerella bovis TaxID=2917790 RepID=UPI00201852CC|nr:AzlD family protein [Wielerella bovis]MCG7657331.1 AzlD family protein [Wielerella bovis]MCG7659553.1 AzlD family protein [Wielerella bovis]
MISWASFFTIIGMLCVTYGTRLLGFFLLKNKTLSPRMARTMEAAPACVLIAVIAPHFVSPHPHELIALALTVFMAARFNMLPTVLVAVGSSALLGWLMGA